jgi:hypothetical protein
VHLAVARDRTTPVINTMFCPYTIQQGADGLPGRNVTWIDEFRSPQN